jgi:hypothetical protein
VSTWLALLGIAAAFAAVLAVVGTALFIGACLLIARLIDASRGRRPPEVPDRDRARTEMRSAGGSRRDGSRAPVAPRRGGR